MRAKYKKEKEEILEELERLQVPTDKLQNEPPSFLKTLLLFKIAQAKTSDDFIEAGILLMGM
jgi:hypothetical protein